MFDLHETITDENEGILDLTRRGSKSAGLDLRMFTDEEINDPQQATEALEGTIVINELSELCELFKGLPE